MSTMKEGRDYVVVIYRCCRDWPIAFPGKVGRCGYCKRQPEAVDVPAR